MNSQVLENQRLGSEKVEDLEAFALKHGLNAEEVQDLVDRIGHDRQALEDAALVKTAEDPN